MSTPSMAVTRSSKTWCASGSSRSGKCSCRSLMAFEYFGGLPPRISYDNSAIAVIEVLKGRERKLTREFFRLESRTDKDLS